MSKLGIIAALPDEAACIYPQRLSLQVPQEINEHLSICLSGIGYNNALNAAAALIKHGAKALISWGVAGAINEELHSGDLLIAKQIKSKANDFPCDAAWQEQLLVEVSSNSTRVFHSALFSSDSICSTPAKKRQLHEKTGADAVDMESAAIAELAQKMGLDFVAIRAIADEAVATIPTAVTRHTDMLGRPKPLRFLLSCLIQPSQVASLLLLGRAYKKALLTLNDIAPDLKERQFLYNTRA